MSTIQPAAKIIHFIVAVGPDDDSTLDDLQERVKGVVKAETDGQVTVNGAEYLSGGKVYRKQDWEAYDGTGPLPQALYQPETPTWMYQTDAEAPDEPVKAPKPQAATKSPAEALAGVKRKRGATKPVVADETPDWGAPPGGHVEDPSKLSMDDFVEVGPPPGVTKEESPDGINTDTVDTATGQRSRTLLAPAPAKAPAAKRQQTRRPKKSDGWSSNW